MKKCMVMLSVPLLLCGCAGLSVMPMSPEEVAQSHLPGGHKEDGYVIYMPQVFLMATRVGTSEAQTRTAPNAGAKRKSGSEKANSDDDPQTNTPPKRDEKPVEAIRVGEWEIRRLILPDYSKPYRVHPYGILAKADFDMSLEEGWMLSNQKGSLDSTAIVALLTEALKAIPGAAALDPEMLAANGDQQKSPDIVLFKIVNVPSDSKGAMGEIQVQQVKIDILQGKM